VLGSRRPRTGARPRHGQRGAWPDSPSAQLGCRPCCAPPRRRGDVADPGVGHRGGLPARCGARARHCRGRLCPVRRVRRTCPHSGAVRGWG